MYDYAIAAPESPCNHELEEYPEAHFCPIRTANPYRCLAKAIRTSHVADNILNREFKVYPLRKALLTDITFLFYMNGVCYLSPILDDCTHEMLSYTLSESHKVDFVIEMVESMCARYGATLDNSVIVHGDQGCYYTNNAVIEKVKGEEFVQSMSRKGNCWDNAPQESFFGHMKDEIKEEIVNCETFASVKAEVEDWMGYYNKERYQWDLAKLPRRNITCTGRRECTRCNLGY